MRISSNLVFHEYCLKVKHYFFSSNFVIFLQCSQCKLLLNETLTCYLKDGKVYCKSCYTRNVSSQSVSIGLKLIILVSTVRGAPGVTTYSGEMTGS